MVEKQSRILVTGSSGFIGRSVCEAFLSDGYEVIGFDRPEGVTQQPGVVTIMCDIADEVSTADAVARLRREFPGPLASVIHLAAHYDFSGEPSPLYQQVNIQGTERLIRHLIAGPVEQFIYSSTMLVHAPCELHQHIDEEWPVDPKWDYPQSKLDAERLILERNEHMPAALLRIAGVYTDECRSVPLANQMQRIYERRITAKVFPGDVSRGQSLVHLEDVVAAFRAAVSRRSSLPRESVILIGEEDPVSYNELQRIFAREIHGDEDWDTTQIPKTVAKAGAWVQDQIPGIEEPFIKPWMVDLADEHYALNTARARKLLDWSLRHTLRDALPLMVRALKKDPAGFYHANKLLGDPPLVEAAATGSATPRRGA